MKIEIGETFIRRSLNVPPGTPAQRLAWAEASASRDTGNVCRATCSVDVEQAYPAQIVRVATKHSIFDWPLDSFQREWERP